MVPVHGQYFIKLGLKMFRCKLSMGGTTSTNNNTNKNKKKNDDHDVAVSVCMLHPPTGKL